MKFYNVTPIRLLIIALVYLWSGMLFGQTVPEKSTVTFQFDHDTRYAARLYTNGVLFQAFTIGEVAQVSSNSFRIVARPFPRGQYAVTVTVLDVDGVESDPSNVVTLKVKPGAPQSLTVK